MSSYLPAPFNPCVASGGRPPDPVFSTLHQNCLEFFGTLPWLFLEICRLQNPKRIFPISFTVPQILVGNEGHPKIPDGEKLVSSVTRVRRAAGGKIKRVYPCFYVQSSQWLFYWLLLMAYANRKLKSTKTRNSNNRATWTHFNVISAATTQFSGTPVPLAPPSTPSDYGEHHQVQTGSSSTVSPNRKYK